METAPIYTGRVGVFLEHKINIQNTLHKLAENPPAGFETEVQEMYWEWRQLGTSKGTLLGYITAMSNLKNLIGNIEETQLPVL